MYWTLITHGWERVGKEWVDPVLGHNFEDIYSAYKVHLRLIEEALAEGENETTN
jgi:hypothetical protein